jgi:coenzyme F420-reducing hydrogenase alpha subunit
LKRALEIAIATAELVATFTFPDFDQNYEFVALSHPDEYAINEGRMASNKGLDIDASEYEDHFLEQQVKHSNALHSHLRERGSYLTGPLARFALNYKQLTPVAKETARRVGLEQPCRNPFKGIVVRAIETVFACEEALRLIEGYEPPAVPKVEAAPRAGVGHAITEAPRGNLYHRYVLDDNGLILGAKIVPPTAQNLKRMEDDLWQLLPKYIDRPIDEITLRCEQSVRNYDPCISCATHFLRINIDRV